MVRSLYHITAVSIWLLRICDSKVPMLRMATNPIGEVDKRLDTCWKEDANRKFVKFYDREEVDLIEYGYLHCQRAYG